MKVKLLDRVFITADDFKKITACPFSTYGGGGGSFGPVTFIDGSSLKGDDKLTKVARALFEMKAIVLFGAKGNISGLEVFIFDKQIVGDFNRIYNTSMVANNKQVKLK